MSYGSVSRWSRVLPFMVLAVTAIAPFATSQQRKAEPPKSEALPHTEPSPMFVERNTLVYGILPFLSLVVLTLVQRRKGHSEGTAKTKLM